MAGEEEQGVIDGGASEAARGAEGSGSGAERGVIKVAKADGDGTLAGGASGSVGSCKGPAEGMQEDSRSHQENVIKELHEGGVSIKGDTPRANTAHVNHCRHDMFGLHGALSKSTAGIEHGTQLGSSGDAGTSEDAASKLGSAVRPSSAELRGEVSLKLGLLSVEPEVAYGAGGACERPAAKDRAEVRS